ncbi:SusD/RagB family nutrient-binding outer membrane lipoprotein [Chitinophaga qingshengii]|uniref:SusD/RagB family nutrient-binding outer membrane lipoprotein n=1 Tax=Chitinophaga qingshengii TaxID=1569794 RepID=A0ABR7TSP0_9BACT|nr:SusD/RagB family nutrient-binding outer membrane lipoprotein [Chitinophaga qingshengii]MBC9932665.1 SusD/RagB family nutrient-binding outer membrane lipoprotein [Chitinophaga qingshengii]
MKRFFLPIMTVLLLGSCTKDFETINEDPTKGTSIAPGQQLAAAAYFLSGGRESGYTNMYLFMPMVQYVNGAYGMRAGTKFVRDDFYNERVWEIFYNRSLKQLIDMLYNCEKDPQLVNYTAAGRILKAYIFSILTDTYGDVPYFEAGMGFYKNNYTPRYDKQEDIYNDLFKELDQAVKQFDDSKDKIQNDIVYQGNVAKWKKLANSLRLRLGMRLTKVNPAKAQQEVQAALAGGTISSADDNFKMIHEDFAYPDLRGNGLAQALQEVQTFNYVHGTTTFVKYLKAENDPRLVSFFVNKDGSGKDITHLTHYLPIAPGLYWYDEWADFKAADGSYVPHGNKFCKINTPFYQQKGSFLHLGYAEVEFLKAEAATRGWFGEDANQHYQQAIRAAMKQLEMYPGMTPIGAQEVTDFVNAHTLTTGKELEQINMQKWVALFPNGYEAYANLRRTGFPVTEAVKDPNGESVTNGVMPRRLFYPATEALNNTKNYQEALNRIGGKNDWLKHVWWDK